MADENETKEADDDLNPRSDDDLDVEAEEEGESQGGLKKILLILVPFLLLGIGGGLYFSGALDSVLGKDQEVASEIDGETDIAEEERKGDGQGFVTMPDLLVNLASSSGQPHFLRLKVQLELYSVDDVAAIEAIAPRVIDRFQTFLREMRVEDLRGSAGIYRLRQELLYRVNKAAAPVEVKDVLFQEILMQ